MAKKSVFEANMFDKAGRLDYYKRQHNRIGPRLRLTAHEKGMRCETAAAPATVTRDESPTTPLVRTEKARASRTILEPGDLPWAKTDISEGNEGVGAARFKEPRNRFFFIA